MLFHVVKARSLLADVDAFRKRSFPTEHISHPAPHETCYMLNNIIYFYSCSYLLISDVITKAYPPPFFFLLLVV